MIHTVNPTENRDLRHFIRVVRRRKWAILLAVLVIVGASLGASFLQHPVYEGKAVLVVETADSDVVVDPAAAVRRDPAQAVQTEIEIIESDSVKAAAREQLGSTSSVSATQIRQTNVIRISARDTDAARAAQVANAHANAYLTFRRKGAVDQLMSAGQEVQSKVGDLQKQVEVVDTQIANAPQAQRPALGAQRDSLIAQQALFKQRLDQLQVAATLKTAGARLVTAASTPSTPVAPRPVRNAVTALIAGLVMGLGLALLLEYLDDSIKSKDDLERLAPELPTLGLIPTVPLWRDRAEAMVISRSDPTSIGAEAYRTLRTSIQFMQLDRALKIIQVTSSSASEGKTTTLANLGVVLARAGNRVILVCCDLRRPRLNEFFGLPNAIGFTSVLLGDVPLSSALQQVPGEDRLLLLASGPLPPNPSELLSSKRTLEVLAALQTNCDRVLIDSPPVLPVTDAAVLASHVDATLLVATAGWTTRKDFARAVELLGQIEAPLIGTVLNGTGSDAGYGYEYTYSYYRRDEVGSRGETAARS
jgi:succinoglycan biosynthesis transport protein ExoP